ncbi:hypothetical protein Hanom_Chr10g00894621 [Helianthus anomalus]
MAKMGTRSSPGTNPKKDNILRSQNILMNLSSEIYKFSNPEIENLASCFPPETVFRPFDPSAHSDAISMVWFFFPALPFNLGYSYPFPDLTQRFFSLTGINYSQAMPMLWRVLVTIEENRKTEDLKFGLSEISYLYSLVTHGSNRLLFKAKRYQPLPFLKTTQNDSTWKNQFFFLRKDSIPNMDYLPKKWILKVTNFACLANLPGTEERVEAFLALDPSVRTFKLIIKDSEEDTSTSFHMSSTQKSTNMSVTKFDLDDINSMLSPCSIKKELSKGPSLLEPRAMTTKAKAGSKMKKLAEPEGDAFDVESFTRVKAHYEKSLAQMEENLAEMEENLAGLRSIATARTKPSPNYRRTR